MVSGLGAGTHFGAKPAWAVCRGADRNGNRRGLAGNPGLARADGARPDRIALVRRYLRIAGGALRDGARDHGRVRTSGLDADRHGLAGIARAFHFHLPLHRARRRTGLARICAPAVAENLFAVEGEPYPRADLGALAFAADG